MSGVDHLFWARVSKGDGCWEWMGYRDPRGYGRLSRSAWSSPRLAHRYSWELTLGEIPDGLYVCHHCDNPPCVNPDHLFVGTARDNNDDKLSKGRGTPPPVRKGIDHFNVTFDDDVVRWAREAYAAGEFQYAIAERLGTNQTVIGTWVRGDVRRDAGGPIAPRRTRRTRAQLAGAR